MARLASIARRVILFAGFALRFTSLPAQAVQGRLLAAADDSSIAGALVQLADSAGVVVARAATTPSGGFAVTAPTPGRYHLGVRQIGHQPWRSDPFRVAVTSGPVTFRIGSQAFTLPEIIVAARRPRCDVGLDGSDLLARLLDAAGTAPGVAEATAEGGALGLRAR
jgi:carboxypeptidase family protein